MSRPARWLAAVAGTGSAALVPDRMIQLHGQGLDILIYPMDLLISGTSVNVARARAAMASRLTTSAAHLTVSAEAQAIEDRLMALARPPTIGPDRRPRFDDAAAAAFEAIDGVLATIQIPYDEWEVLYRQRLQVERDLRAGAMAEDAVLGAEGAASVEGVRAGLSTLGRIARTGAGVAVDVATDERTGQVLDRIAGPQWRWAIRAASVAAIAAREALRAPGPRDPDDSIVGERNAGEPSRFPADLPANDGRDTDGPDAAGEHGSVPNKAPSGARRGARRSRPGPLICRPQSAAGASYSRRRGNPLVAATRRAASPRAVPAATSRSTSDRAAASGILGRPGIDRGRSHPDHEDEFASRRDPAVGRRDGQLTERPADDRLVQLRQLAAHRSRPFVAARPRKIAERGRGARGRLEHDTPARIGGDRRQPLAPLATRAGQEPFERPTRPGNTRG